MEVELPPHWEASDHTSKRQREIEHYRLRKWELLTLSNPLALRRVLDRIRDHYDILHNAPQLLEAPIKGLPAAVDFYSNLVQAQIEDVFHPVESEPQVRIAATEPRGSGEVVEVSFLSGFTPLYQGYRDEYLKSENNRRVHVRIWRLPKGESKGTLIAIPGWYMADPRLSAIALLPGFFFSQGYNVAIYELPYSHRRMCGPKQLFPSSNLVRTNEGIFQAIYELRQLRRWLEATGEELVGVIGASFGGYLAALWATLEDTRSVISVSPAVDLLSTVEHIFFGNTSSENLPALRMALERIFAQVSREALQAALEVHTPLARTPKAPNDKRLLIAAESDEVVLPEQAEQLARHWNLDTYCRVPGGHFGQLCTDEAQTALSHHLRRL